MTMDNLPLRIDDVWVRTASNGQLELSLHAVVDHNSALTKQELFASLETMLEPFLEK